MKQEKVRILTRDGAEVVAFAPVVLSVSRATDIPAFYAEWFFNRLEEGYCKWRNPFNGVENYVSFEKVRFIVFWSKNPAPLIPYLERLKGRGINCYVQYTLNDYEAEGLEPCVPAIKQRVETFIQLAEILGPQGVVWRFLPMLLPFSEASMPYVSPKEKIPVSGSSAAALNPKISDSMTPVHTDVYTVMPIHLRNPPGLDLRRTLKNKT